MLETQYLNKSKIILPLMEVTTLSTKGQIVIPKDIRKDFEQGSAFTVSKVDELIVLKPVKGITKKEIDELKELKESWKEIESGKAKSYSEKEFFKELKKW